MFRIKKQKKARIEYFAIDTQAFALYTPEEGKIQISKIHFPNYVSGISDISQNVVIMRKLAHEVGHHLTKNINKIFRYSIWGKYREKDDVSAHIVVEGIVEYFNYLVNKDLHKDLQDDVFKKQVRDFEEKNTLFYARGFTLAKPILEEFGFEGIKYLLKNPIEISPTALFSEIIETYHGKARKNLKALL